MSKSIRIEVDGRDCIGLDVGDRWSHFHREDALERQVSKGRIRTRPDAIAEFFGAMEPARIALEVGTHSPWLSDLLTALGHEVTVANAARVALVSKNQMKGDKVDAMYLCWLLRTGRRLLFPIRHRGMEGKADLAEVHVRDAFVKSRTQMINLVRGKVKSFGARIPSGVTPGSFHMRAREHIPTELRSSLYPVLEILAHLTSQIREQKKKIDHLCREKYPETKYLLKVNGVGPITALSFVLTIEDPSRFPSPRDVGAYLGLVPRRRSSGTVDPELSITKAGDSQLRRLLVQCAHHILGWRGEDSDLRRWGCSLADRGKKGAKKRAVIAVARKLSVILLSLWMNEQEYKPLRRSKTAA